MTSHQVGTWMTNVRKRRLYPLIHGRRNPKTHFDHCVLTQHKGCKSKKPIERVECSYMSTPSGSGAALRSGEPVSEASDTAESLRYLETSPYDFFTDESSCESAPWDEENNWQQKSSYPDVQFYHTMDLASPHNVCGSTPLELVCT
jgi:hypothetical protein